MFAPVQRIMGSPRVYPLKDVVTASAVLNMVDATDAQAPGLLHRRDIERLGPCHIAVNPRGRQVTLVLTTLGNRDICYLVHRSSRTVEAVPCRFGSDRHQTDTVARCTLSTSERVLVVNDAVAGGRAVDVDEFVHRSHTPDAALFPLRVVARRRFSTDQELELRRFIKERRIHSIDVVPNQVGARAFRIVSGQASNDSRSTGSRRVGDVKTAHVRRAAGPDAYQICVDGSWEYMAVRTMQESAYLSSVPDATLMRVEWDGSGWRPSSSAPAHPVVVSPASET